jgi:hypothetical protein
VDVDGGSVLSDLLHAAKRAIPTRIKNRLKKVDKLVFRVFFGVKWIIRMIFYFLSA